MGYLFHLLGALLAQGLAETGWTTGWKAPWAVPLLVAVPYVLSGASRRAFLRGRFRASALLHRLLSVSGPILQLVALCGLGWSASVQSSLGAEISLDAWPGAGMLLVLLPFLLFEVAAIDARSRIAVPRGRDRSAWRSFHVRSLLSAIVPFVAYVLATSAVGASRTLRVEIEEVALFGAAFAGAMLAGLALALPTLLSNVWDTSPMPPGLQRDVLASVAAQAGFRARSLRSWNTGDLMANAAIVGIGPRTRVVLFSDSLLSQLELRELAAVFAHEIGHAARRHVLHFVVWAGAFFLLADVIANRLLAADDWLAAGFLLAAVVAWLLVFGFVSRRFELEADLFCLDLLGDATALIGALEKVGGHFRDVASWRHFSTAARVRFLAEAAVDPSVGRRLRSSLGVWKRIGLALLLVALGLQAWTLARSFGEDRTRADLRLGRYASAAARSGESELDPRLGRLVRRAASLEDEASASTIEERARASLAQGEVESALEWLELGELRGLGADPGLESLREEIEALGRRDQ